MAARSTKRDAKWASPAVSFVLAPADPNAEHTGLDMPGFINQMLAQYQDLLVQQVKSDTNHLALEEVMQLQSQAQVRLSTLESEAQKRVATILDQAREGLLEVIRNEMAGIFGELVSRLEALVPKDQEMEAPTETKEEPAQVQELDQFEEHEEPKDGATEVRVQYGLIEEPSTAGPTRTDDEEGKGESQEVCLELPAPLDLVGLLGFYRVLSEAKSLRVLRSLGSVDEGVTFYIRPRHAQDVTQVVRALPGVRDVVDSTPSEAKASLEGSRNGNADARSLTIRLMPTT